MGSKVDRTGEKGVNTFGSEMVIVRYKMNKDIDVYFPEYDWTAKNVQYDKFKKGNIKCPYERTVYRVGYLGEGKYKCRENGKITKVYNTWHDMLTRCYNDKFHERNSTYIDCEVDKDWLNFQKYGKWFSDNYYEIDNETMCLDKDILVKHNKIYSPETCIFVPQTINLLFTKRQNDRGESVIGTTTRNGKYRARCCLFDSKNNKSKYENLGTYDTEIEAFQVYKYYKEKNIKEVADYYKNRIPEKLYKVLYNYEVEIDD